MIEIVLTCSRCSTRLEIEYDTSEGLYGLIWKFRWESGLIHPGEDLCPSCLIDFFKKLSPEAKSQFESADEFGIIDRWNYGGYTCLTYDLLKDGAASAFRVIVKCQTPEILFPYFLDPSDYSRALIERWVELGWPRPRYSGEILYWRELESLEMRFFPQSRFRYRIKTPPEIESLLSAKENTELTVGEIQRHRKLFRGKLT